MRPRLFSSPLTEQGFDEVVGVELSKILGALAEADVANRDA